MCGGEPLLVPYYFLGLFLHYFIPYHFLSFYYSLILSFYVLYYRKIGVCEMKEKNCTFLFCFYFLDVKENI
jgi:hypothetical protein